MIEWFVFYVKARAGIADGMPSGPVQRHAPGTPFDPLDRELSPTVAWHRAPNGWLLARVLCTMCVDAVTNMP